MSEINVHCDEISWGEIFPGIFLVQAGKLRDINDPYIAPNGVRMYEGCYGLTISNDPFVVFSKQPIEENDNFFDFGKESEFDSDFDVIGYLAGFDHELTGYMVDMYILQVACKRAGWDDVKHGIAGIWIADQIAKYVKNNKPVDFYPML